MATIADWRGITNTPVNLPVVGSRLVMAYARLTMVSADDSAGTMTVRFPNLRSITGFFVTIVGAGNNVVGMGEAHGATTGVDITIGTGASANVLTIADGTSIYALTSGDLAHVMVVGPSKL